MNDCTDSPTGKHVFSKDYEYDQTNPPTNCQYCGTPKIRIPWKKILNLPADASFHDLGNVMAAHYPQTTHNEQVIVQLPNNKTIRRQKINGKWKNTEEIS